MERISQLAILISLFIAFQTLPVQAQIQKSDFQYAVTQNQPYGAYNPEAPEPLQDFEPMIGSNLCESVQRSERSDSHEVKPGRLVAGYDECDLGVQVHF